MILIQLVWRAHATGIAALCLPITANPDVVRILPILLTGCSANFGA
jgi:hypothetical protein